MTDRARRLKRAYETAIKAYELLPSDDQQLRDIAQNLSAVINEIGRKLNEG